MKVFKNVLSALFINALALFLLTACYSYSPYCPYCGAVNSYGHKCSVSSSPTPSATATPTPTPSPTPTATPATVDVPTSVEIVGQLNTKRLSVGMPILTELPLLSRRAECVLDYYIKNNCIDETDSFKEARDEYIEIIENSSGSFSIRGKSYKYIDCKNIPYSNDPFKNFSIKDSLVDNSGKYVGCAAKIYNNQVYCTIIIAGDDNSNSTDNTNSATSTSAPAATPTTTQTDNNNEWGWP